MKPLYALAWTAAVAFAGGLGPFAGAGPWGSVAHAQVIRCTDARTGQVSYTDGACSGGAVAREVEPRKSAQELQHEREQAAQALENKQQRLAAEAQAARNAAQQAAERDRMRAAEAAAAAPRPHDYARSPACAKSRRQLEIVTDGIARDPYEREVRMETAQRQVDMDCLGPQGYAEVEKARANQPRTVVVPALRDPALYPQPFPPGTRPVRPAPPPRLTQCGDYRCTDNQGNTYPRNGPGRFPGSGGVCRSVGGQAPC